MITPSTIFLVVALTLQYATAQTPKSKFDSKVKSLGMAFCTVSEIGKFTDCIDDHLYECASMDKIADKCLPCAVDAVPISKYTILLDIKSTMDKCLKAQNQTTMKLIDKILPYVKTSLKKVYDKVTADVKAAKDAKLAKQAVYDKGYTTAASAMTKALIEQVCKTLVQKITNLEWNCFLSCANRLVDFTKYECSKIVKS